MPLPRPAAVWNPGRKGRPWRRLKVINRSTALEVDIDESCLTMIALYQPAATDLRFITTAMKIVTTLERIGDLAGNISHYALDLIAAMENTDRFNASTDHGGQGPGIAEHESQGLY